MDYFTQTVGSVVDAFNTRYATFDGTTLTIDAKTLRTNLNAQISAAQSELATVTTITSALVIEAMDNIIKNVISSGVSLKDLLNEDMYNALGGQIDSILSAGGDPLNIFSTLDSYNGDIFSWICDSLIVPVSQILGDSTLDRLTLYEDHNPQRQRRHGISRCLLWRFCRRQLLKHGESHNRRWKCHRLTSEGPCPPHRQQCSLRQHPERTRSRRYCPIGHRRQYHLQQDRRSLHY